MCWSFAASLAAGLVSWAVGLFLLYKRNSLDVPNALFLVTLSSMQFVDATFWHEESTVGLARCSAHNKAMTSWVVPFVLTMELVVSALWSVRALPKIWNTALVVAAAILFHSFSQSCTRLTEDGHLWWGQSRISNVGLGAFLIMLLRPRSKESSVIKWLSSWPIFGGIACVYFLRALEPDAFGSYWCFLSTGLSMLYMWQFATRSETQATAGGCPTCGFV